MASIHLVSPAIRVARNRLLFVVVCFLVLFSAAAVRADDGKGGFTATLANCTELIGFGPVRLATVQPLVPSAFTIVNLAPGTAGLVVRTSSCDQFNLDHGRTGPALVAQIGVAIVSPDGSGDINNYSLLYVTNNEKLAEELREAGLPAQMDRTLAYEFTPAPDGSGELYAAVSPVDGPYFLTGTALPPPGPPSPVVANWWFAGRQSTVKLSTSIPAIAYGSSTAVLHTSNATPLGRLIGGNSYSSFLFLNARGVFASGQFAVSVSH